MTIKLKSNARSILANNIVYYRLQKGWSQEDFPINLELHLLMYLI